MKRKPAKARGANQTIADRLPAGAVQRDPAGTTHAAAGERLAAQRPFNANKSAEFGAPPLLQAMQGDHVSPDPADLAGTLSEANDQGKTGGRTLQEEGNAPVGSLGRHRIGVAPAPLTTNQGVALADNQASLKMGVRGPTLLEDFILREKLTHFDHERIPERVVHARGSGAHGYFECTRALNDVTRAHLFGKAGRRTPVFVRFSTVVGERGSTDTARDVRGFAVKFYTAEGNWDLVGNNIPVFFIQDAMKFPDLVHAVRPEPHNAIPQAASAHDTFWDFVSLMPEATHMLCWVMSDRAIPRSYRMMQGFGVHTFRFVNERGESRFVKFHWTPAAGVHSLLWDEAVRISGADPDFHRRDLWDAIEAGAYPEWSLGVQLFTESEAEAWSFDVLDPTKLIPEELCPLQTVGRLVLDRNPDNFFAETEQVAFCTAHVVPGIDFSNDPLLAGRHHSYLDTQLSRLGGPNFHELPINAPLAKISNNQRDGMHRQSVFRGKAAYEPNSLAGGCPFQAGMSGYVSFPSHAGEDNKLRGKPEKFGEHYAQARLFVHSLMPHERRHLEAAFRFELSKVTVPAIRARMVAGLRHVDDQMAARLASDLGLSLPEPLPLAVAPPAGEEATISDRLSQTAHAGNGGLAGRRVAMLVADGIVSSGLAATSRALERRGIVVKLIGERLGLCHAVDTDLEVDATYESSPSVLFDGVIIPADATSIDRLVELDAAREFVQLQYRHCKPISTTGNEAEVIARFGVNLAGGKSGLIGVEESVDAFIDALAMHRLFDREPAV